MTGETANPTCAKNAQVQTAPAEMPGVEEIARAIYNANLSSLNDDPLSVLIHCSEFVRDDVPLAEQLEQVMQACRDIAKPVAALFAPILAEKDGYKEIVRQAAAARDAAGYIGAVWDCIDDLSARALAAEAALAAERERNK